MRRTERSPPTSSPGGTTRRKRFLFVAIGLVALASVGIAGIGIVQFISQIEGVARGLARTESRLARVAPGSVVTIGDDTIAVLVEILGARGLTRESDSLFVFRGRAYHESGTRLEPEHDIVAVMEPVSDWAIPIHLRLVERRRVTSAAFRQGRLVLDGVPRVFDVVVVSAGDSVERRVR